MDVRWFRSTAIIFSVACIAAFAAISLPPHGHSAEPDQRWVAPYNRIRCGLTQYFRLYGRWPDRWSDVVDAGINQTELNVPDGRLLRLDDQQLDFSGDAIYGGMNDGGQAVISYLSPVAGVRKDWAVNPGPTFASDFAYWDSLPGASADRRDAGLHPYSYYLSDEPRLKHFAIVGMVQLSLAQFYLHRNRYPSSIDEFLRSGFAPVDRSSINPITGQTFKFDGSANDIIYTVTENYQSYTIYPIMEDGKPFTAVNIY